MSPRRLLPACLALALCLACLAPAGAAASFGIKSLSTVALNRDGTIDNQAGSHPFEWTLNLQMNLGEAAPHFPEGTLRSVVVDLPPGMAGNPLAVPRCSRADFEGVQPRCPANTQIGFAHVPLAALGTALSPVYNLVPPLGVPASVGFSVDNGNSFQEASLRSGSDYGVSVSDITVPTGLAIQAISETIWGVPAEAAHDPERWCFNSGGGVIEGGCTSEAPEAPFFTLPTSCTGPLRTTVHVESLQEPGKEVEMSAVSENEEGHPEGLRNCEAPPFSPTVSVQPQTAAADSPTGLHVALHIPQNENPGGLATANLKETRITLPPGLVVNPSAADGLGACSQAQIDLHGSAPANCPAASKLGTVSVSSPKIVDHPLAGAVYLAREGENPFGSLLALYIAVDDPLTGVVVKLAGKVEPDPQTGQLRATFAENPQLPFEDLSVDFFGGPRAALTTPQTCGTYTATAALTPWTAPEGATATRTDSFPISSGAQGGPCPQTEAAAPHSPSFEAGTAFPIAGTYSPFAFKLARQNGSQRIAAIDATLPKGLVGKLAGIPYCSEAQIAAAAARSGLGQGALEQAAPSCPLASEVGTVNVGAGSGSPFYVQGHAYLAGPYKGAPLSLAIITPAVAGPFDLGTVVVRTALYVDETTAQIHAISDPIPAIRDGIPLDVRSISLQMNRPDFMLNPTSCNPMAVLAGATSTLGQGAQLSSRFQVGACGALGFSPKFSLKLSGGTKRNAHPALEAVLTQPSGQANIARLSFTLPASEFIDPNHVANPCTRPQFAAHKCPPSSVLGKVRVFTPLLEKPLEGPVYFRANGGERELPDAVVDLSGQVHLISVGFLDALHKKGSEESRVRTTIATVPDAAVSKIVIKLNSGKKKGVFVNSQNLCRPEADQHAIVKMTAQNGKVQNSEPLVANSCSKKDSKRSGRHHP